MRGQGNASDWTEGAAVVAETLGFLFAEAAMTQLELAKEGIISPQMESVAQYEGV